MRGIELLCGICGFYFFVAGFGIYTMVVGRIRVTRHWVVTGAPAALIGIILLVIGLCMIWFVLAWMPS